MSNIIINFLLPLLDIDVNQDCNFLNCSSIQNKYKFLISWNVDKIIILSVFAVIKMKFCPT